nr:ribonucleoside-diphosphate reductase large subunit-like isoform X6 [Ipomoea trifida]
MELLLQMEVPRKPPPQKRATVKPIKPEAVIVISPDTKEEVKEKNSLRRKAAAEDSSRKTYTATLTARSKVACGLNIKLPMEKIEDIDAGDVYNELAVVEYAEDIYKFYKEAEANQLCRRHLQDIMLCGGSDSVIIPTGVGGFIACRALSQRNNDPTRASLPLDSDRDGFVMGEGAGVLLLEELEHAKEEHRAEISFMLCGFLISLWKEYRVMGNGLYFVQMRHQDWQIAAGKAKKVVQAQNLWFEILKSQIETGTPYMLYKTLATKKINQQNLGTIKSSNLCTEIIEYTSPTETVFCNLASIALPRFVREKGVPVESQPSKLAGSRGSINRYFDFDKLAEADTFILLGMAFYSPEVKEKNSLRRKAAAEDSSRKTYTATLTARSKAACGLDIKLPKEKIEDIDAGDVYNELAVLILADAMGLGKTVMTIALILARLGKGIPDNQELAEDMAITQH